MPLVLARCSGGVEASAVVVDHQKWVGKRWQTREFLMTDAEGKITWRGFKGSYWLEVGAKMTGPFQPGDAKLLGTIKVP